MSLQYFKTPVIFDNNITATKGFNVFGSITASNMFVNNVTGTFYGDGSNLVGASLPGQSAINTVVQTNSSNWNIAYNIGTAYQSASSSFSTNSLQTTLNYLSTNNILLSSLRVTDNLFINGSISAVSANFINITNTYIDNITTVSSLSVDGNVNINGTLSTNQIIIGLNGDSNSWNTAFQRTSANDIVRSNFTFETPTTGMSAIQNIVSLSQATYDALTVKSPTTLYLIV